MNMKKTMAAVAACAIATSAVATTAFADDSVSLKYNLVNNVYVVKPGSVTFNSQIEYVATTSDGQFAQIQFKDLSGKVDVANAKMTVTGNAINGGVRDKSFSFVEYVNGLDMYSLNSSSMVKCWQPDGTAAENADDETVDKIVMTIPIDEAGSGIKAADGGFTANVSLTAPHSGSAWNGADLHHEFAYVVEDDLAASIVTDEYAKTSANAADFDAGSLELGNLGTADDLVDASDIDYGVWTPRPVTEIYGVANFVEGNADAIAMNSVIGAWSDTTEEIVKYPMLTTSNTTTGYGTGNTIYTSSVNKGGDIYIAGKNIDGAASNILAYLCADEYNLSAKGKSYINVVPVINDVIANYDDVTFTFNTAADNITFVEGDGYKYKADGELTQYTKFAQHLYNLYGDENTEYVYTSNYDWTGYNLWAGALVVNGNLTMSLQDTNVFDYGATTLSFNWNDAVDGAVVNTYATYLTKMQLATSSLWFWDSLEITAANTEAEDVASDAGAEADEDVIEEDVEEDVVEDIEEDVVEDVVEDIEEPVVEDVVEDVPVVENPGTGNAPVALAVIPVALAAAAVVAKKRG